MEVNQLNSVQDKNFKEFSPKPYAAPPPATGRLSGSVIT